MFSPIHNLIKCESRLHIGLATALILVLVLITGPVAETPASTILAPTKDNKIARCSGSGYDTNFGGLESLWVRAGDGNWSKKPEPKTIRSILQFDLTAINTPILQAKLGLYYYQKWSETNGADPPADRTYEIRRLLADWDEGVGKSDKKQGGPDYTTEGSSWKNRRNDTTAVPWDSRNYTHIDDSSSLPEGYVDPPDWFPQTHLGGGDFPYTDYDGVDHWGGREVWATAVMPEEYGWIEWDISQLARHWQDGSVENPVENHGLIVMDQDELWHRTGVYDLRYGTFQDGNWHGWGAYFHSKEYEEDVNLRPYLEITSALPGDANLDGQVNDQDAAVLATHWQMQPEASWSDGDFNGDGVVNDQDAAQLAANWQADAFQAEGTAAPVPEPSVLVLLGTTLIGAVLVWVSLFSLGSPRRGVAPRNRGG